MPLPDIFNEFKFTISEHDGFVFRPKRTFTSKFDEIYELIDHEKGDITRILYDFSGTWGTTLNLEYLITKTGISGRKSVIRKSVIIENVHYIPKNALIHDMFVHERFLKYFKVCLRYNEPEIGVYQ